MKVGMIFECGPDGADKKVCERLAKRLRENVEVIAITLDNKPNLIQECGQSASELLEMGCDFIIIVWDLFPPWRGKKQKPCRREDRESINTSLTNAGVSLSSVYLVCITEELEAWLLSDGRALSEVLSRPTHQVKIPDEKKTERIKNPKKKLAGIFKQEAGLVYTDRTHAEQIVIAMPDLNKIYKHAPSFARFADKLNGES